MSNTKSRDNLQNLFAIGNIPSATDFRDLFNAGFNKNDDGLDKTESSGLMIQGAVTNFYSDPKDLLLFHENINDSELWKIFLQAGNNGYGLGFVRSNVGSADFMIDGEGKVGIGTDSPDRAFLEVHHSVNYPATELSTAYEQGDTSRITIGTENSLSAYFTHDIACHSAIAFSDARTKDIIGVSDGRADLQTIMNIKISDYQMKDRLKFGSKSIKKVIAQQVEEVYPEAVSRIKDVIPDIMKKTIIKDGWIKLETDLQTGEKVKLIMENSTKICIVKAVREDAFLVDIEEQVTEVFVYGREVDDFRTVDYNAISMLNVSATQDLYRQVQQLQQLEEKVNKLEAMILSAELTRTN